MAEAETARVRRRRVFYIPGYDPIHPRRYRELYRREGAAQAAISGHEIALVARPGAERFGWQVEARIEGARVETGFEVLVWSDIVRASMRGTVRETYARLARTAWIYIGSGALRRLMRLRKGPVIAALYPVAMLLAQAAAAALAGWAIGALVAALLGAAGLAGSAAAVPGAAAGLAAAWGVLRWFKSVDTRVFAHYLMHDYAYSAEGRGAYGAALEARLAAFTGILAEAMASDVDEVLVVGHSSGAHLGVSVLADLLRRDVVRREGPALGFLSLGQVIPMVSFLPEAHRLRGDLRLLSESRALAWLDVTAPGDGCCFALCDPVAVSGVAGPDKRWPLVISAAFTQTLSPERWRAMRRRFFRLHFQYLCAFDRPGDYDYFRITAGPLTLSARFAGRRPSASRIEAAVSKYTSLEAA